MRKNTKVNRHTARAAAVVLAAVMAVQPTAPAMASLQYGKWYPPHPPDIPAELQVRRTQTRDAARENQRRQTQHLRIRISRRHRRRPRSAMRCTGKPQTFIPTAALRPHQKQQMQSIKKYG